MIVSIRRFVVTMTSMCYFRGVRVLVRSEFMVNVLACSDVVAMKIRSWAAVDDLWLCIRKMVATRGVRVKLKTVLRMKVIVTAGDVVRLVSKMVSVSASLMMMAFGLRC